MKALNISRFKSLLRVQQCDLKRKRRRAKKDRQSEQAAHKLWVERQKYSHMYGKETPKSSRKRRKPERDKTIDVPNGSRKKFEVDNN